MNKKGFTLIELLVWISISTILMISVWLLVSWWIKNITNQEKALNDNWNFRDFQTKLQTIFNNINTGFAPVITWSWIILKINQNYDEGGFVYIWETNSPIDNNNWIYCLSWSENINTKHIFIKTFIPWFDIDIQKSHTINWIWKDIFWDNEISKNWIESNKVYLNNPTGIETSWTIDFISDTLNNRILYKSWSKIYELLNMKDWLSEPTDLYINNWNLYIANSWNWEILKYSSNNISTPNLTLTWVTWNINNFTISFYDNNWKKNLNSSNNTSDFSFSSYLKQSWDSVSKNTNKLTYSFSWWINQNLNNETITISNLSNFTWSWTYFVKLDINDKFYKYFTQWDNNLLTKDDNTLEIIKKDTTKYYIKINNIWNYNEYSPSLNMLYDSDYDYILRSPIKSLDIEHDNINKLLDIKLNYYNKYNCYNTEEKSSKILILKKNFK